MYDFHYHRPKTLADAANLLKGKDEARPMSGGMTLIPTLKQRLARVGIDQRRQRLGQRLQVPEPNAGLVGVGVAAAVVGVHRDAREHVGAGLPARDRGHRDQALALAHAEPQLGLVGIRVRA